VFVFYNVFVINVLIAWSL